MKAVTIVKRFLNRTTPSIPLPGDIDEESASPSGTWLLVAQNTESPEPQLTPTTTTTACQTMASPHPFYETHIPTWGKIVFEKRQMHSNLHYSEIQNTKTPLWRTTISNPRLFCILTQHQLYGGHPTSIHTTQSNRKIIAITIHFSQDCHLLTVYS